MHYGDKKQLEVSKLVVNIYKHSTPEEGNFEYKITSISHCSYISIWLLKSILNDPNPYLKDALKDCIAERWYCVSFLTPVDDFNVVIGGIEDVSESGDEIMRLH